MPSTVQDLIEGRQKPVTVTADVPLQEALTRMLEHGYSQLPVVDGDAKPIAMVTSDSVMRALNNLRVKTADLRVSDTMVRKPNEFRPADDVFDVLGALRDASAVLIVDAQRELVGIVTSYDAMEYFRQRSQDIMFVQDIEEMLKSYINAAFTLSDGRIDEQARTAAIEDIMPSNKHLRSPFQRALLQYLQLQGEVRPKPHIPSVETAFTTHLYSKEDPKPFDELTLYEYIGLFVHDSRWNRYSQAFRVELPSIRELLHSVRKTRNALAHFREDLSPQQRDELRFCKEWLTGHEAAVSAAFALDQPPSTVVDVAQVMLEEPVLELPDGPEPTLLPEDEATFAESRYAPLGTYLQRISVRQERVLLPFQEIEHIIGDWLPASARQHRSWWANDAASHVQSQQWLDVGWRVATVNMGEELVTFARIEERQRAYIDFFSPLLTTLREASPFPVWNTNPDGGSWIGIASLRKGTNQIAGFNFAFTRSHQFRVELYIDGGNQIENKQLFDMLYSRREWIEQELNGPIAWERMSERRASRIAVYRDVFITSPKMELLSLHQWAVEIMLRFHNIMVEHVLQIVPGAFAAPQANSLINPNYRIIE